MTIKEKEQTYLRWKALYYMGNPEVPDETFDHLENELKDVGSNVINQVGAKIPIQREDHWSQMLSLDKINVLDTSEEYEQIQFDKWLKKELQKHLDLGNSINPDWILEGSPKFDGNAFCARYYKGRLVSVLTRGEGEQGVNITHKLAPIIPTEIHGWCTRERVQIRGEVLIDKKLYYDKYADPEEPKNPRNFVTGVLNSRNVISSDVIRDLTLIGYDLLFEYAPGEWISTDSIDDLNNDWNKVPCVRQMIKPGYAEKRYPEIFEWFRNYRDNQSQFLLDGFVLKLHPTLREHTKKFKHHPDWAIAVKFPPSNVITKVNDIRWTIGKNGNVTPTALLEPVDLDGTTVQRASMYNAGYVLDFKTYPGAIVRIQKAGEIIPQIIEVVEESTQDYELPTEVKGIPVEMRGVHLMVTSNEEPPEVKIERLISGINVFDIKGIGDKTAAKLFHAGYEYIWDLFTDEFNIEEIEERSELTTRQAEICKEAVDNLTVVKLHQVIQALQWLNAGSTISKRLAELEAGMEPDFKGLTKKPIEEFQDPTCQFYQNYLTLKEIMELKGIEIEYPRPAAAADISVTYEMTGKPTTHGKKAEFQKFVEGHGWVHSGLNSSTMVLVTDDPTGTSGKMKKARQYQDKGSSIRIMSYDDVVNELS